MNFTKPLILVFFVMVSYLAEAQQDARDVYIEKYAQVAVDEMNRSGIPASITLAQGILESGNGKSELASKHNNHFGIKCHSSWTGAKTYHDDDAKGECFRKYKSAKQSFRDHTDFLVNGKRYAFLFELDPKDYKAWARGLKKAGYATSDTYAERLIAIIEEEQLYLYDTQRVQSTGKSTRKKFIAHRGILAPSSAPYIELKEEERLEHVADSLGIKVEKLLKWNNWNHEVQLKAGDKVYIKAKKKRGPVKVLERPTSTSPWEISQETGVRLDKIYQYNNLQVGERFAPGQKIYLRKPQWWKKP